MIPLCLQKNLETLHEMIEELQKVVIKAGLNINTAKTKTMINGHISDA